MSILILLIFVALTPAVRAADAAADAVAALAQLTSPTRLAALSDDAFAAQLGPALGWLHVGRRRDVSPEAIIARAFQANGLDRSERAQSTREALLKNLARADAWELFNFEPSAQALALGRPAVIPVGLHQGKLARAVLMPVSATNFAVGSGRDFANLALRADDEPPLSPPRPLPRMRRPRADERLARKRASVPMVVRTTSTPQSAVPRALLPPIEYDDALPIADPVIVASGKAQPALILQRR